MNPVVGTANAVSAFGDGVERVSDDVMVVSCAACQRILAIAPGQIIVSVASADGVIAGTAIDGVVAVERIDGVAAAAAHHHVVEVVAGQGRVTGAGVGQVFDRGGKVGAGGGRVEAGDGSLQGIDALAGILEHLVSGINQVSVVAGAAIQAVGTCAAIERVIAGQAVEHIGGCAGRRDVVAGLVARQGGCRGAGVAQTLEVDVLAQAQVLDDAGGLYGVEAAVDRFEGLVCGVVDDIGVVSTATHQGVACQGVGASIQRIVARATRDQIVAGHAIETVCASTALEGVVQASAGDGVRQAVALQSRGSSAGIDQIFNVIKSTQRIDARCVQIRGPDRIGTAVIEVLDDDIRMGNDVGVVAITT